MFDNYVPIILLGTINVASAIAFYLLNTLPSIKKIPYIYRQIFLGVFYGGLAIAGTEFGADIGGAVINVRDAAPLTAGLIFGGPAGLIAGTIGGIERILASLWGVGIYTKWACSISTFLAGVFAALLRKWMFDNKAPNWAFGLVIAIVMESLHIFLIFITHMYEPYECLEIVRIVTFPMILANAIVMFLITLFTTIHTYVIEKQALTLKTINRRIQFWLLLLVIGAALSSNVFLVVIQNSFADETSDSVLDTNIYDIESRITEYSDQIMGAYLNYAYEMLDVHPNDTSAELKHRMEEIYTTIDLSGVQINYVSNEGKVIDSSDPSNIGFDMYSTEQSKYFHQNILYDGTSYIQNFMKSNDDPDLYIKSGGKMFNQSMIDLKGYSGYLQFRYSNDLFDYSVVSVLLDQLTKYRRVYANGYAIIFDFDGNVVCDYGSDDISSLLIHVKDLKNQEMYKRMEGKIFRDDSHKSYYMYSLCETYYVFVCFPVTDLTNSRDSTLYLYNFISVIIYAAIFVITYYLVEFIVVKNIRKINDALQLITKGDLSQTANVRSTAEFDELSTDINIAVNAMKGFIDREARRLDEELSFARKVQASSLPNVFPPYPTVHSFDIYATMNPAKQVGGDFYDFFLISRNTLAFLVADVSGKGIPASMFMMESKAMLKNFAIMGYDLADIFKETNNNLCQGNEANMFVTCWMGILDLQTGIITYCNAGHNCPIIYRKKEKKWAPITQKKNMVLAGFENLEYKVETLKLEKGDRIFLYTDGVNEATRSDGILYGEKRLLDFMNNDTSIKQKDLLDGIKGDIEKFIEGADQFDDITMLTIDYKGD